MSWHRPFLWRFIMNDLRRLVLGAGLLVAVLGVGCQRSGGPDALPSAVDRPASEAVAASQPAGVPDAASSEVNLEGAAFHVRGPRTYENMAVFFLCSDRQDRREFLTLDEGLKEGLVKITEQ